MHGAKAPPLRWANGAHARRAIFKPVTLEVSSHLEQAHVHFYKHAWLNNLFECINYSDWVQINKQRQKGAKRMGSVIAFKCYYNDIPAFAVGAGRSLDARYEAAPHYTASCPSLRINFNRLFSSMLLEETHMWFSELLFWCCMNDV